MASLYDLITRIIYVYNKVSLYLISLRYLWKSTEEWITERFEEYEEKGQAELALRAVLRWLDKNIFEMFTDGLKAVCISYQWVSIHQAANLFT